MLLCSLNDVRPGSVLGAVVSDPNVPGHDLLRPGVPLHAAMINTLRKRGVQHVWIEDDFTRDLDAAVAPKLAAARAAVYAQLRDGLNESSRGTLTSASIKDHRRAVLGLVIEAIGSAKYASLTDSLFSSSGQASHGANVAYLALLTGLHIETYVVMEQKRLDRRQARDMSVLGLAGLLHDIGKTRLNADITEAHESAAEEATLPEHYHDHTHLGQKALESTGAPARVVHAVLNHHQRFDGSGWPDFTSITHGRINKPLAGKRIHIFARIVAAANVLDNLISDAARNKRPAVSALHAFASSRFDGWFDPVVRRAMLLRMPPFSVGTEVRLSDDRRAVVIEPNPQNPCRPTVRILPEDNNTHRTDHETFSLALVPDLTITHSLGEDVTPYLYDPTPLHPHPEPTPA
jgi:putative nucleotidyltransferase with HDIG domain